MTRSMLRVWMCLALALSALAGAGGPVAAGSAVGELEYRFPCRVLGRREIAVDYNGFSSASVALEFHYGAPVLSINEQLTYERPYELVAFEYFSACEMAKFVDSRMFLEARGDQNLVEDWLVRADCGALNAIELEGLASRRSTFEVVRDFYGYRNSEETYLNVPFWRRAENMEARCAP